MEKLEIKLLSGDFFCVKDNKNQQLSLKDLKKKQCYTKCLCEGTYINCKFLDYRTKEKGK